MVSYTREDKSLSGGCRPLNGINGRDRRFPECLGSRLDSDERFDTWLSRNDATWTDAWKYLWVDTWEKAPIMIMLGLEHYARVKLVGSFSPRVLPKLKTLWLTRANI